MEQAAVNLADLTTFHIGGPAKQFVRVDSAASLAEAVAEADHQGMDVLVVGGGSNLLVADSGFDGVVIQDQRQEITEVDVSGCGGASVRVSAGTNWDDFVAHTVDQQWMGAEALSGIPGTVGAAPVQNIGAYGQEVAGVLASVRVFDRLSGMQRTLALADLKLGYRQSIIKSSLTNADAGGGRTWGPTGRWVVLDVEFQMRHASLSAPIQYGELARKLGVEVGDRVPSALVREAVLELRAGKGMVVNPADHDTWSAGSFFTNPVLSKEQAEALPQDAPRFPVVATDKIASISFRAPQVPDLVKTSAAWLINNAGFGKGFSIPEAPHASLSTKHVLALTNRGGASAADIVTLARHIRQGVFDSFGVTLVPEPVFVGLEL